jgi:hypothetical protein
MKTMENMRLTLRECLFHSALLVALLAVLFPGTFLRGEFISPADILFVLPHWNEYAPEGWESTSNAAMGDHIFFTRPNALLCQQALKRGEWPLWNHLQLAGMPLLANFQTAIFYPGHLLRLFLPIDWALTVCVLLKLFLCGLMGYASARLLSFTPALARFFSVAWILGSYNLIWCYWPLTDVAIWVPPLFTGIEFVLRDQYRRGGYAMLFSGTLLLLAGHPETAFTFGLGLGAYFLLRLIQQRRTGMRLVAPIAVCALAWGMIFAVCAAQLLPFFEYLPHSTSEQIRQDAAGAETYAPGMSAALWVPRFYGTDAERNLRAAHINSNLIGMLYPGMVIWVGGMLLFARGNGTKKERERRNAAVALAIPAALGLLLSFYTPSLHFVHELPVMNELREWYHACFAVFAFPLVATMGFEHWFARQRRLRELLWALPPLLIGGVFVFILLRFDRPVLELTDQWGYVLQESGRAAALAALALALCAVFCFKQPARIVLLSLILLLAADSLLATRGLRPTLPPEQSFPETALIKRLQSFEQPCRVSVAEGYVPSGIVSNYGIEEWLGYDGLYPERVRRLQLELGPAIWKVMEPVGAIHYYLNYPEYKSVIDATKHPYLKRVDTIDGMELYENPRALPRAFLVPEVEVIPDFDAMFKIMRDPEFEPAKLVVTEEGPTVSNPSPHNAPPGQATVVLREPTRVLVVVDAASTCALVLADAYYPGWKVTIDGKAGEIFPAYYAFRGVLIPAGRHTVEFTYFPLSFRLGLVISTAALLLGAYSALRDLRASGHQRSARIA